MRSSRYQVGRDTFQKLSLQGDQTNKGFLFGELDWKCWRVHGFVLRIRYMPIPRNDQILSHSDEKALKEINDDSDMERIRWM